MASGYVVAAFLEAAGLVGLVIAVLKMRTERRAKAVELRSFLRSGLIPAADIVGARRLTEGASRAVAVPFTPSRGSGSPAHPSAARSALERAIVRGGPAPRKILTNAISAG
jgi:hypothetical protein